MSRANGLPQVVVIGECMVELRHVTPDTLTIGFAGDTYNAAVYLARAARQLGFAMEVGYLTGLGDDDYSDRIRSALRAASITDRTVTVSGAAPGLYIVRTDPSGERHFDYWRDGSAAAKVLATSDWALRLEADIVYLSGITLQLTPQPTRTLLNQRLAELRRQGSVIAFDTNYRAAGWRATADAQCAISTFAGISQFVFATYDDEQQLFADLDPEVTGRRYLEAGAAEVIVKLGAEGALVFSDNRMLHVPADQVEQVVDTTAAGDSFAGTYLASRLAGASVSDAGRRAASVAAQVVTQVGAIVVTEVPQPAPPAADIETPTYASAGRRTDES
jgi:2-dehydro-3-deoxygluconokinase